MIEVASTAQSFAAGELDVDHLLDEKRQVLYIGKAKRQPDGTWRCLAAVQGALCVVEVTVTPPPTGSGPGTRRGEETEK